MASDLEDHFDRVEWVRDEIRNVLTKEVDDFEYGSACQLETKVVGLKKYIIARPNTPMPKSIPIRAGVLKNELRAVLDSLACTLAIRFKNSSDIGDVSFPIADSEDAFKKSWMQSRIEKLSPSDQQLIATLRPFKGGNDWLYALHVNDRTRKHRRLLTTAVSTKGIAITGGIHFKSDKFAYGGNLADGVVVAELGPFSFPELKVSASICFAEPPFLQGKELVSTLYQLTRHVEAALKIFN